MIVLKQYNDTYFSLLNINEKLYGPKSKFTNPAPKTKNYSVAEKEEVERISRSRTKRHIKDICLSNDFQFFMTVTVSSKNADRFSLQETQDKMKKVCHKLKRNYKDFKFIFITEKHQNGAFHFHGMIKGIPLDSFIIWRLSDKNITDSIKELILKGEKVYHLPIFDNELGLNSFSAIEDYNKCCSYITKYVTKDCVKNESNQIYFCSRGLKRPTEDVMIDVDLKSIFDRVYENEYCQKVDFDISMLSDKQKYELRAFFEKNDEFFQRDNNIITNWLKLFTNLDNRYRLKIHK